MKTMGKRVIGALGERGGDPGMDAWKVIQRDESGLSVQDARKEELCMS